MKLMTLNCHSWQEENQIEKIKYLAKVIVKEKYDVIALQEVSQLKSSNKIKGNIKEDNFIEEKYGNSYFLILMNMILITALFIYIFKLNQAKKVLDSKVRIEVTKNRKKDLQLLNQAKMISVGETLNNIAHQWRQPLSVITTSASGLKLQKEIGNLNDEDLDNFINHIVCYFIIL